MTELSIEKWPHEAIGFKYIAKDADGRWAAYTLKPFSDKEQWRGGGTWRYITPPTDLQSIEWEKSLFYRK